MPMFFLNQNGEYFEATGDIATRPGHTPVPQRPQWWSTWNGSSWDTGPNPDDDPAAKEAEVQEIADNLTQDDERLMALAMATVDLRMSDVSGMTTEQVRQAFRDRVVHYLRQRRGL